MDSSVTFADYVSRGLCLATSDGTLIHGQEPNKSPTGGLTHFQEPNDPLEGQ